MSSKNSTTVSRRSFLRGGATAAALAAAGAAFGCAPNSEGSLSATGEKADATDLNQHVVDSDGAILEGRGRWQGAPCPKGCSLTCSPCQYVVDNVPMRGKVVDYFEEDSYNRQLRSCHAYKVAREWIYSPSRIKYPMKRKGWQPGGGENSNGQMRGKDEWERISWDEALDLCASEIKRIYETYGPTCTISFISMGGSIQNVLNLMGGYVEINDTISCGTWQADTSWWGLPFYGNYMGDDPQDWVYADYFVLASSDPVFTANASGAYLTAAKEAGAKFVYVGPCYNQGATQLEARWIPVRPGTDTAFWNGVAYEMVKLDESAGDVIDWEFLAKYTKGFTMDNMPDDAKLQECYQGYLLGEYDDTPKTAAWASLICGAPEQDIKDMAAIMSKQNNVILATGTAAARCTGVENYPQVIYTIGLMGGHMGKQGNAVFYNLTAMNYVTKAYTGARGRAASSIQNPLKFEAEPGVNLAGIPSVGRNLIAAPLHWRNMLEGKYTSYGAHSQQESPNPYNSGVEHDINVKFIWNGCRNFLSMSIDLFNAVKVYRNCEFVLTNAVYASTVARFSDIVLPVPSKWEGSFDHAEYAWPSGTVNRYYGVDFVSANYPVCEPMWECHSDDWISREIGARLGFDPDEIVATDAIQSYFNCMAGGVATDEDGTEHTLLTITQDTIDRHGVELEPQEGEVDFEEFVEHGGYQYPRSKDDAYAKRYCYQDFIDDPAANPLPSASGLWEIYSQLKADNFNTPDFVDPETPMKPYPNYYEPTIGYEKTFSDWDKQIKGDYPYQFFTFHPARGSHSDNWSLVGKELYPHSLYINPVDAQKEGLEEGDTARIWNPDGGCILRRVTLMEGVMPGCLGLAESAGNLDLDESDPEHWIDRGGSANVLTPAVRSNYMPGLSGYNNGIVNIEKYEGEPVPPDCERDIFQIEEQ